MTIGNFHLPANTNVQNVGSGTQPFAYYYIDDVSVMQCNVGVVEVVEEMYVKLYPNPNNGNMTLEYNLNGTGLFTIYDVSGRLIKQQLLTSENTTATINAAELDAGVYLYEIKVNDKKVKIDKLIIIK